MIYLVRHGETELNAQHKFYGSLDVSINERGSLQSLEVKAALEKTPFVSVYTSEMKRTKETAEIICSGRNILVFHDNKLNEKGFGLWEGLDANQIQSSFPEIWESWLEDPFSVTPPSAEPFSEFKKRVVVAFTDIKQSLNSEPVLIVGHLGALRVIYQTLYPNKEFWDIDIPQGTYLRLRKEELGD